ncbi:hypothetical protein AMTRI_Chr01g132180 [Amborella trichopoda]|uniref:1-phosphatidylinositol-4-phosphate 5-kinase n=1 Tax=Amborella trichopoda TaxID=13333 RepID=W1PMT8_AMBTC|nr:phosphatidylinositol 4-phosphate 5-kinase 6 [Amborella trichopoda]ERN09368.1 hypothetical protein AMTR_s00162p00082010 [Amborella trichopoda]|eukprot:XP_020524870.1 phosphatidylinositol 4-phosphate 5-kinase 6 [Amborella trichopoda]
MLKQPQDDEEDDDNREEEKEKDEDDKVAVVASSWESKVRRSQQQKLEQEQAIGGILCMLGGGNIDHEECESGAPPPPPPLAWAEKVLANGDFYTGLWSEGLPHGSGKYLWTDGCMYEGDWCRGRTTGKGKFSWPSGATYEGEFKNGFMDGDGTYTGASGDTYHGRWSMNLKHGHGFKSYANGDYHEGSWRHGVQEGKGRYVWRNGNEYVGEWKGGVMHGRGYLLWANGNRFDGEWEEGEPKGHGVFTWADGSCYVGTWSRDPREQSGTYYPSRGSAGGGGGWDQQDTILTEMMDCKVSPGETVSILPSQKMMSWTGAEAEFMHKQAVWRSSRVADSSGKPPVTGMGRRRGSVDGIRREKGFDRFCIWETEGDITCEVVDRSSGSGGGGGGNDDLAMLNNGNYNNNNNVSHPSSRQSRMVAPLVKEAKRQGETIKKGHKNYELMLNLQLGITHSVGKPAPAQSRDLRASDFDPKERIWTRFPPEGSKHTPPHQSIEFRWKDYCPLVFRYLRRLFKIDAADYMLSLCGNDALRELSSPGKSGSFFYLTHDDRYMIKTMKKSEVKVLLRMLPSYYNHVRAYENTLVTKFFGLHCVKAAGGQKVRFIIMGNLFCSEYHIHRRFDLKGSSHGRITDKPEAEIDETTTLKDLDLNFVFRLQKSWFQELRRQVDRDCEFLETERIMDYSLLVGLHFLDSNGRLSGQRTSSLGDLDLLMEATVYRLSRPETREMDQFLLDPNKRSSTRLGINLPARVEHTVRRSDCDQLIGEPTGELCDVIIFFGIIDILQDYDISKKLEHAYKSIQYDPTSISAVDPRQYSRRFRDFIYRVFVEDT